jgi:hypothetical protein
VCIFDRSGRLVEEVSLPAVELPVSAPHAPCCTALQWDPSAEVLAVLPAGNTFVYLWHAASKELHRIDSEFKVGPWCRAAGGRRSWARLEIEGSPPSGGTLPSTPCGVWRIQPSSAGGACVQVSHDAAAKPRPGPLQPTAPLTPPSTHPPPPLLPCQAQELTSLAWSRSGSMLAVGTAKGNLLLYSSRERRKLPVVGKATRRIVSVVWSRDGRLALASADKTVSAGAGRLAGG